MNQVILLVAWNRFLELKAPVTRLPEEENSEESGEEIEG
jgi:hypothetical protein